MYSRGPAQEESECNPEWDKDKDPWLLDKVPLSERPRMVLQNDANLMQTFSQIVRVSVLHIRTYYRCQRIFLLW